MKEIDVKMLQGSMMDAFGKEWMLVTAGNKENFNTMTASWGGIGWLWNRPVAFLFVRPERYTHQFIEANDYLTLSFLGDENKSIHAVCGKKSGRDTDKIKETGLKPIETPNGSITFEQARLTLEGRKLFKQPFTEDSFLDKSLVERWYGEHGNMHDLYIMEITHALEK
ncbi:MAG: flavin reductase [Phocaeicola sp.]